MSIISLNETNLNDLHNKVNSAQISPSTLSQRIRALEEAGIRDTFVKKRIPPYAAAAAAVANSLHESNYYSSSNKHLIPNTLTKIYQNPQGFDVSQHSIDTRKYTTSNGSSANHSPTSDSKNVANNDSNKSYESQIQNVLVNQKKMSTIYRSNSDDSLENDEMKKTNNNNDSAIDSLAREIVSTSIEKLKDKSHNSSKSDLYANIPPISDTLDTDAYFRPPPPLNFANQEDDYVSTPRNHSHHEHHVHEEELSNIQIPITIPVKGSSISSSHNQSSIQNRVSSFLSSSSTSNMSGVNHYDVNNDRTNSLVVDSRKGSIYELNNSNNYSNHNNNNIDESDYFRPEDLNNSNIRRDSVDLRKTHFTKNEKVNKERKYSGNSSSYSRSVRNSIQSDSSFYEPPGSSMGSTQRNPIYSSNTNLNNHDLRRGSSSETLNANEATAYNSNYTKSLGNEINNIINSNHNLKNDKKNGSNQLLIFNSEYTRGMSQNFHTDHFSCWNCDQSLTGSRYILKDEHPYCIKCYEELFAHPCEECKNKIGTDSKDLSYKDKHWHEKCFFCHVCKTPLIDKPFGSKNEALYCGECYNQAFASRCDKCAQIFKPGMKKMEYKGQQFHENCFLCFGCNTAIGTKSFIPKDSKIFCVPCYEQNFATKCTSCTKVISQGGVTYKNQPFHRECFTCTNCKESLAGQRFTSRDEQPYCSECFGKLFAKKCFACTKPITGIGGTKYISFEDRHWHNDCFVCNQCHTSLVGRGFLTDAMDILCPDCGRN